ncbi:chemotaxis protein CheX [uncultured Desulfuromonas sp.]|uniref:chemotaxis protein CheX n=1 Tax=uncultured Desulfuromonas sp. TaxID=181013 RepID=UPI002AAB7810|nr:chemotaxis protein CheX [uncultured Desulfuromonas sp.]
MDLDLQKQIIDSTQAVFDTMLMMPLTPGMSLSEKVYEFKRSISGMLGFAGEVQGMLTIHCPQDVAFAITSALLGIDVDEVDADVKDTVGEMANMILGGIKDGFTEHGVEISLAVPTVLAGRSYRVSGMDDASWTTVPFYLDEGELLVELKLKAPK